MPEEKLTEQEILETVKQFRTDAVASSANLLDRMRRAEDFKVGIQWDSAVKEANEKKGKFCLTIPLIKPTIKQIVGSEIQNPKDVKVRNVRSGSATAANILTALAKHAMDSEHVRFEKSLMFESGLTSGVGVLGFFIDKTDDPRHGNLTIEKLNEFEVLFDPNCKVYDPNSKRSGCKYVIWEMWVDKEQIEAEYPDKKGELEGRAGGVSGLSNTVGSFINWLTGAISRTVSNFAGSEREDVDSLQKYRYQLSHTWWRKPKQCIMWYDNRKSEVDSVLLIDDDKIASAKQATKSWPETFSIEEVVRPIMHHTIRVGDVFLEDRVDELSGVEVFPLVPFYPYFDNGYKAGMAEDLIGTQEEINWSHSQTLNLIKQLANSGWKIGRDFAGYAAWLAKHGGEDGIVIDESKGGGKVEKIMPNPFPVGFHAVTEQAKENFKTISNVRTEDPQYDTKGMSGKAIYLKQQSSLTGSAPMFLNYDYTMSLAGNLLIDIIRSNDIYSVDEIMEIVDKDDLIDRDLMGQARQIVVEELKKNGQSVPEPPEPFDPAVLQQASPEIQQAILREYQEKVGLFKAVSRIVDDLASKIAQDLLLDEIKNLKKGQYSTTVTLSQYSPTLRIAKAAELFELNEVLLKNQQMPISRKLLVNATDIDGKEEIIEEGEQQQQQMAQMVARK